MFFFLRTCTINDRGVDGIFARDSAHKEVKGDVGKIKLITFLIWSRYGQRDGVVLVAGVLTHLYSRRRT